RARCDQRARDLAGQQRRPDHPTFSWTRSAGTGVDPLDNAVGTQIADFKPVTTAIVTDPITSGGALSDLPVVGSVTKLVTG
ncbi:hypothetical protein GA0115255_108191, partial [Streptomyces sp. Ncost-T6T-2b]